MNRCSGHCCKAFILGGGQSLEQLRELASGGNHDAATWLPLIESLGEHRESPIANKRIGWSTFQEDETKVEFFRCKALQPNGDCGVYGTDARPLSCADWPYRGEPCSYVECTWDEGRVPLIAPERLVRRPGELAAVDAAP